MIKTKDQLMFKCIKVDGKSKKRVLAIERPEVPEIIA